MLYLKNKLMIPKIIHYSTFGDERVTNEIEDCIESWKKVCPGFEIKHWNELNFQLEKYPFASKMYNEKKWDLVDDFARLQILYEEGGIYLDKDMLLVQSLEPITSTECAFGEETSGKLGASMIASDKHHPFIHDCLNIYEKGVNEELILSTVINDVYKNYPNKSTITLYPPKTFYPFTGDHIKEYHGQALGPDVIGIRLWQHSWRSPFVKLFRKITSVFKKKN